ncbi:cytochrome P450 [Sansalvadorimonas sp. 2012CJ34-2]|uniref:Cytochrome P450 n=1 Tax=Parendozoicomonas callyspongiae TaxID=2942213 RepID=A0ABT0PDG0_9GAMM|nr:cytochrome P450 [Sansalvadorimonas sp. 2012CJ34-2]MCL6268588.1 cytochrome P450 [Sansalvadorimonas sp. 2012CJ34-2]
MKIIRIRLLAKVISVIWLLHAVPVFAGVENEPKSTPPSSIPDKTKKDKVPAPEKRYVVIEESDISPQEKERAEFLPLPLVGEYDEIIRRVTPKGSEAVDVKLLADYLLEKSKDHPICRMNTHPSNCMLRWLLTTVSRESWLYPWLTYLKDNMWVWDYDIASGILAKSFGTHLVKQDIFTMVRIILGEFSLFGTDAGEVHTGKRQVFKVAFGPQSLKLITSQLDKFSKRFVSQLSDSLTGSSIRLEVGKFLMSSIISTVFGFDVSADEHRTKFDEIREHFQGVVEASVKLPFDYGFQMRPRAMRDSYLRQHYGAIYDKKILLLEDIKWLVETAKSKGVLDNIDYMGEAESGEPLLRAVVRNAGGHDKLTEEDYQDLLNPMIAGTDTGSFFQMAVISELARDRESLEKIIIEMKQVLTKFGVPMTGFGSHEWTDDQMTEENMPTLHLLIEKILMELPPVPVDSRRVKDDFVIYFLDREATKKQPQGRRVFRKLFLRAGETMTLPIYYLNPREGSTNPHISPELMGLPLKERVKYKHTFVNRSQFHACVGQHFIRKLEKLLILNLISSGRKPVLEQEIEHFELSFKGTIAIEDDLTIRFERLSFDDIPIPPQHQEEEMEAEIEDEDMNELTGQVERLSLTSSTSSTGTPTAHQTQPVATLPLLEPPEQ